MGENQPRRFTSGAERPAEPRQGTILLSDKP
jgi:hypothetical protein